MDKIDRKIWRRHLRRNDPRCTYCGQVARDSRITLDHVVPVSQGGPSTRDNLVLCCAHCNQAKRDRSLSEWIADLLSALYRIGGAA